MSKINIRTKDYYKKPLKPEVEFYGVAHNILAHINETDKFLARQIDDLVIKDSKLWGKVFVNSEGRELQIGELSVALKTGLFVNHSANAYIDIAKCSEGLIKLLFEMDAKFGNNNTYYIGDRKLSKFDSDYITEFSIDGIDVSTHDKINFIA